MIIYYILAQRQRIYYSCVKRGENKDFITLANLYLSLTNKNSSITLIPVRMVKKVKNSAEAKKNQ